jgi:arylsulfatase A-like enzyme
MKPSQPNIILINVDQWRGDCLSIDGHPVVKTPYLDQLAGEGVRFARAYAACPSCIPARASLYTGLTPRTHGRVGYRDGVPWNYPVTIASEFTRQGYQTQAIGKLHVYPERSQIGFQNVILHDGYLHHSRKGSVEAEVYDDYLPWLRQRLGPEASDVEHGLNCNSMVARPWDKPESLHPTNFIVTQAASFFLRRDPRKPFFLMLSFHRPHPPYDPPAWAFEQYLGAEMPEPPVGDWIDLLDRFEQPHSAEPIFQRRMDPVLLHRARAGYYGHMSHIDAQIKRLTETLIAHDLHHNTWICFVSDHGELMGDHHMTRKQFPYEGAARVPLLLHGPPGSGLGAGASCNELAELRDVMPTLLDAAGLAVPASVEGRSLLPFARGAEATPRVYLHGEHALWCARDKSMEAVHWITDARWKYIWWTASGREQLFDLADDPQELRDLARPEAKPFEGAAKALATCRRHLIAELKGRPEGFVRKGILQTKRPVSPCLPHIL